MAVPTLRGSPTSIDSTGSGVSTITVVKPTGTASTDIMVLAVACDNTSAVGDYPFGSGWTALAAQTIKTVTSSIGLHCYWSLGSNANLTSGTKTGSVGDVGAILTSWQLVDNTTPMDVVGTAVSNSASATIVAGAITPATTDAIELIFVCDWLGAATYSSSGWTANANAGTHASVGLLYKSTSLTAGTPTSSITVTDSNSATNQLLIALPFALRPATPGGGTTVITQSFFFTM